MSYGDAEESRAETSASHARGAFGLEALQQAAVHLADIRRGAARFKTRDLVNLLLVHAARSRRASLTRTSVRLRVQSPDGEPAIILAIRGARPQPS